MLPEKLSMKPWWLCQTGHHRHQQTAIKAKKTWKQVWFLQNPLETRQFSIKPISRIKQITVLPTLQPFVFSFYWILGIVGRGGVSVWKVWKERWAGTIIFIKRQSQERQYPGVDLVPPWICRCQRREMEHNRTAALDLRRSSGARRQGR